MIPSSPISPLNSLDVNCSPWSEWIWSGIPYLATHCSRTTLATLLAVISPTGMASAHLVNLSIMVSK